MFVVLLCLVGLHYDAAAVFAVRLVSVVGCCLVLVCLCLSVGLVFVMWGCMIVRCLDLLIVLVWILCYLILFVF